MPAKITKLTNVIKPHKKVYVDIDINNTKALKALDEIQAKARETFKTLDKLTEKLNQLNTSIDDGDDSADLESER